MTGGEAIEDKPRYVYVIRPKGSKGVPDGVVGTTSLEEAKEWLKEAERPGEAE